MVSLKRHEDSFAMTGILSMRMDATAGVRLRMAGTAFLGATELQSVRKSLSSSAVTES